MVILEGVFKTNPSDQAELFNTYFYQQFSEPSNYEIPVKTGPSSEFNIDFSNSTVLNILKKLNPNKGTPQGASCWFYKSHISKKPTDVTANDGFSLI